MKILVSSSATGAKKITCFGPDEHMIPNQLEISNDESKFSDLLQEGLEFYNLDGEDSLGAAKLSLFPNKCYNPVLQTPLKDHIF